MTGSASVGTGTGSVPEAVGHNYELDGGGAGPSANQRGTRSECT